MWDEVLTGIQIVVSTPQVRVNKVNQAKMRHLLKRCQVLLDALIHGFVTMSRLTLLVFDEGRRILL